MLSPQHCRLLEFQSTPSGGKATIASPSRVAIRRVSIHAFRGEGDVILGDDVPARTEFQSTPSGGKATDGYKMVAYTPGVSIHAFRGEGDAAAAQLDLAASAVSIHAFRGEGDVHPRR